MFSIEQIKTHRRGFLGTLAAAAATGLASLTPLRAEAEAVPAAPAADPSFEAWLNRITGKHKMVFDAPEVNGGMPVVWPRVWLNGNNDNYGTTDAQNSGVVILRHASIPLAMVDALWAKYNLGEVFSLKDGDAPAMRNTFAKPLPLPLPGTGVEQLLAKGVMFGVCNVALTIYKRRRRTEDGIGCRDREGGLGRGPHPRLPGRALRRAGGRQSAGKGLRLLLRGVMRRRIG